MDSQRAFHIVQRLQQKGHIAYFAGGSVRDMLLGIQAEDFDVATDATVEEITALFEKTITVGAQFGVVVVLIDGRPVEVATFRQDGSYSDGRKPDSIRRATPEEDAKRRDFTINGLFFDPIEKKLYDYVGGQEDLKRKRLCAIGAPKERFAEDRLRMLRAVRFAIRFDLTIEKATYQAIQETSHLLFPAVSVERVFQEFTKMAPRSYLLLEELGLLKAIFPHRKPQGLERLPHLPEETPTIVYLALMFFEEAVDQWLEIAGFFKCSREQTNHLLLLDKARKLSINTPLYDWALYLARDETMLYLRILAAFLERDMKLAEQIRATLQEDVIRLVKKKPLVDAAILQKENIKPGPKMGMLLKKAEELAINGRISSGEELLKQLKALNLWLSEK